MTPRRYSKSQIWEMIDFLTATFTNSENDDCGNMLRQQAEDLSMCEQLMGEMFFIDASHYEKAKALLSRLRGEP